MFRLMIQTETSSSNLFVKCVGRLNFVLLERIILCGYAQRNVRKIIMKEKMSEDPFQRYMAQASQKELKAISESIPKLVHLLDHRQKEMIMELLKGLQEGKKEKDE